MSSIADQCALLQQIVTVEANQLARETGCIKRQRKFTGTALFVGLVFSWLTTPDSTLATIVQNLGWVALQVSIPGLFYRFTEELALFLERMLHRLVTAPWQEGIAVEGALLRRFNGVFVEDSSTVPLPDAFQKRWRGCGGSRGTSGSALKVFVRWNLTTGEMQGPLLSHGRTTDTRSPLSLEQLPAGCLYVADLGFYSLKRLLALHGRSKRERRFFLTRHQPGVGLWTRSGHRLSLRALVPKQVGQRVEISARLGRQGGIWVRVLMERVPKAVGDERRERIKEAAADHGREAGEEVLRLADWTIVLTNASRDRLRFEEVLVLMRARWQIERLFRLWKEYGQIDEWRSKQPWRILCEIYAKLSAMVIQQWLTTQGCWDDPHRSLIKAAQVVRREANRLAVAIRRGNLAEEVLDVLGNMHSGCQHNRRRARPSTAQLLEDPSLLRWPDRPAEQITPVKKRTYLGKRWPAGKGWNATRIREYS
ncbi:MAG: IS4 family transposase [Ktedonobacteraceae bacterium]|nr:IS4 family transposase [Chloroflexota bacterium]